MKMPVLEPLLLTSATEEEASFLTDRTAIRERGIIALNRVCQNVRDVPRSPNSTFLIPINNYRLPFHRPEEYYACRRQIQRRINPYLNIGYTLVTIAGASHVGYQANLCGFRPDLMAVLENDHERLFHVYLYNG